MILIKVDIVQVIINCLKLLMTVINITKHVYYIEFCL